MNGLGDRLRALLRSTPVRLTTRGVGPILNHPGPLIVAGVATYSESALSSAEWAAVVAICVASGLLLQSGVLAWRDALSLGCVLQTFARRPPIGAYTAREYLPPEVVAVTGFPGDHAKAHWIIFRVRGVAPTAYPVGRWRSILLLPYAPSQTEDLRLFVTLHELGHVGPNNYLTATSGVPRHLGQTMDWTSWIWWRSVLQPSGIFFGPCSVAPATTFILLSSELLVEQAQNFLLFIMSFFTGDLNRNGLRLEAEIEADHFALTNLARVTDARMAMDDRQPSLHPLFSSGVIALRDPDLAAYEHEVRSAAFDRARSEAFQTIVERGLMPAPDIDKPLTLRSSASKLFWHSGGAALAIYRTLAIMMVVTLVILLGVAGASVRPPDIWAWLSVPVCATLFAAAHVWRRARLHAVEGFAGALMTTSA